MNIYRNCDSRNINRSPFCDLSSHDNPQKWSKEVTDTYADFGSLDYVKEMKTPIRHLYPTKSMQNHEIVTSHSKAIFKLFEW